MASDYLDDFSNVTVRCDGPVGDAVAFLEAGLVVAFDDRDELDVADAELVAEVAVHVERVILVGGIDGAQHVEVDVVRL